MFGFIYAATLLVAEMPPTRADVGVVLAGDFSRALYAADLYQQGVVPTIWLSSPERERSLQHLDAIGVPYPRQEDVSRAVLLKKGVPSDRIEVVGEEVVSTIQEARAVAKHLSERSEVHSVLVITSQFHVRRAQAIFSSIFRDHTEVVVQTVGTPYDGFVVNYWWKDRESARQVVLESAKLLLFWCCTEL